jgi:hypothetical protein
LYEGGSSFIEVLLSIQPCCIMWIMMHVFMGGWSCMQAYVCDAVCKSCLCTQRVIHMSGSSYQKHVIRLLRGTIHNLIDSLIANSPLLTIFILQILQVSFLSFFCGCLRFFPYRSYVSSLSYRFLRLLKLSFLSILLGVSFLSFFAVAYVFFLIEVI